MSQRITWLFPVVAVVMGMAYVAFPGAPYSSKQSEFNLQDFATLPVVDRGRAKPLDTLARTSLMIISGKQTFVEEEPGTVAPTQTTRPAIKWLLDVMTGPRGVSTSHKVFRIENDQVLQVLGLKPRPGFRYALNEMEKGLENFYKEANRARQVPEKQRDLFDNKLLELAQHFELFIELAQRSVPHFVPPSQPGAKWRTLEEAYHNNENLEMVMAIVNLIHTYKNGETTQFNEELNEYRSKLMKLPNMPATMKRARLETLFNRLEPFYRCAALYAILFVLGCLGWLGWSDVFRRTAFWLAIATLVVHSAALCTRMYLQGRPPVTNLYSSAIFIGWGSVALGIFLEWIFRNGMGNAVAAVTGGLSLIVAHYLSTSGDTMEMMQAVLDTNFWLATHVTCVTMGYTATYVAGFLGLFYVLSGLLTRYLADREQATNLSRMIYGVVCFATLFSFTGTVLGGLWADYSWGRFWGWDPKENGALIIVLWNVLVLHARWGGMVKQRGMAVLAIGGNIVTTWSWFGVNMLGIGLHSYGFMSGALFWILIFVLSQVVFMGVGMLPLKMWVSFIPQALPKPSGRTSMRPAHV
jgi:ABC-type transport system involved in cytochrome c biogenesis permease subunit